jgi:ABC-type dipeptide/oligopeptide/nickel transport system permease subunit
MIARGQSDVMAGDWWESFFPGIGILVLAVGFQLVGEGLSFHRGEER